jgi:hypothetical protein
VILNRALEFGGVVSGFTHRSLQAGLLVLGQGLRD